jgi:tight adherence protein B
VSGTLLAARLWAADLAHPGGWVLVLLLAAGGVLLWPGRPGLPLTGVARGGGSSALGRAVGGRTGVGRTGVGSPGRGRRVRGDHRRPTRVSVPGGAAVTVAPAAGVAVGAVLGILPGLAAAIAVLTAGRLVRGASSARRRRLELAQVAAGLRLLARELRSGASVPQACVLAGAAASGGAAELLETLAREVRFGVGGPADVRSFDDRSSGVGAGDADTATMGRRLRAALRLSARRGIPLAALVEAFASDVEARAALADRRATDVAGPQLSGYLLAALPAFGLLMGAAMGAAPLTVLLHTGLGQLLLVVGVCLSCLGLAWISRIVRA